MKSSSLALIVAILALLIGSALYFYDQKNRSAGTPAGEEIIPEPEGQATGGGKFVPQPSKIDLVPLSGIEANAVSNRVYTDKKFILTVNADLPTLDSGVFYQVWLAKGDGDESSIMSVGKLEDDGGSYYLEYKNEIDLSPYNKIFISKEKTFDVTPEEKIMEGTF